MRCAPLYHRYGLSAVHQRRGTDSAQVQFNGGLLDILECVVLKTNLLP